MYLLLESQHPENAKPKGLLVDPADTGALGKVRKEIGDGVDIVGVLTTHHHEDHAGGNHLIVRWLHLPFICIHCMFPPSYIGF